MVYLTLLPIFLRKIVGSLSLKMKKALDLPIGLRSINFLVTYKCNSRCLMCDIWKRYQDKKELEKKELTIEEIRGFLLDNRDFLKSARHIGLTGGEPFLRDDLVEIIRAIRQILPHTATGPQTNGLLPEVVKERLKEIKKFYPGMGLAISLDGIGETHDKIRGVKESFEKAVRTLNYARELGLRRITSGMTLNEWNYKEISKVKALVERYDAEFSCFLPDSSYYFYNPDKSYQLSNEVRTGIIKELSNFPHHYYMNNLRAILEGGKRTLPCYSGYTSIVIDPYGNVLPCILRYEVLGNIREKSLKEILHSQRAQQIRERLKGCTCWNECEVSTSAVVDILDVLKWFLSCSNKKKFLRHLASIKKDL